MFVEASKGELLVVQIVLIAQWLSPETLGAKIAFALMRPMPPQWVRVAPGLWLVMGVLTPLRPLRVVDSAAVAAVLSLE